MNDEKRDEARVPLVDFRIMDVEKYAEYAHEMHQFMRQKAHETQTQFDKTLVYLCGGAIALSYGLFTSNQSGWCILLLFSSIVCWGVCCIMALLALLFQSVIISGACSGYYSLYSVLGEQSRMVREISDIEKTLKEEFLKINITPDVTPEIFSDNRLTVKQGEELHKKHEDQKARLKKSIDTTNELLLDINNGTNKMPTGNWVKLLIFVFGVCFFFAFTYFTHVYRPSQISQSHKSSVRECSVVLSNAVPQKVECKAQSK